MPAPSTKVGGLIPWLNLKGVSTNDFPERLKASLGEGAAGLSPSTVCRLKAVWEEENKEWSARDLSGKRFVCFWADGIHFNVRLGDDRPCVLVVVETLEDARACAAILRRIRRPLRSETPEGVGWDGSLGFWVLGFTG